MKDANADETGYLDWGKLFPKLLRDKDFIKKISQTSGAQNDAKFQIALRNNLVEIYAAENELRRY
ncbi:MAG TPA: hypothetical protein PKA31_00365 [Candidatus Moranbacteria bacterium]|nr:hypothetical protein [Candidatus Moranbacteria bacterium]